MLLIYHYAEHRVAYVDRRGFPGDAFDICALLSFYFPKRLRG